MAALEAMQVTVAVVATVCGGASFVLYLVVSARALRAPEADSPVKAAVDAARTAEFTTPADLAELVKALGSLTDSLAKAGPALWSLIGSALFLLIAAVSAGALQSRDVATAAQGQDTRESAQVPPVDENLPVRSPGSR